LEKSADTILRLVVRRGERLLNMPQHIPGAGLGDKAEVLQKSYISHSVRAGLVACRSEYVPYMQKEN
jgi:hypothetical protein